MGYEADPEDFIGSPRTSGRRGRSRPGTGVPVRACPSWRRAQDWELTRYRAYQAQLAGRRIGDTFSQAASFLRETAERSLGHAPVTARTPFA